MTSVKSAANPLPFLLEEERQQDHQATEAIFLTFNVDLGFFEVKALGACRSAGARVRVVADAGMWNPDPYATKFAGSEYHVGLANVAGAFHPKVVILAGPRRAIAAIGSGNLTLAGWQYNQETWTILTGDKRQCPAAFAELADALEGLATIIRDRFAAKALIRAGNVLKGLLADCEQIVDTGHRILTTLTGPIVDQLPSMEVDQLWMHAPFHDLAARGVRGLLEVLHPRRVTIMVQPGQTVMDPRSLREVLERSGADWEMVADAEDRYRHGKLIEWANIDGNRHALTGSANLSHAALLSTVADGNLEICVLSPIAESLFPASRPVEITELPRITIGVPADDHGPKGARPPALISAILEDEGSMLAVRFSSPLGQDTELQVSHRKEAETEWQTLATVPAGVIEFEVTLIDPLPPGSPVRLRPDHLSLDSSRGVVFVTDPDRVRRRRAIGSGSRTAHRQAGDLWGEEMEVINDFAADLAALAADSSATRAPGGGPREAPETPDHLPRSDTDITPWLWLEEQATSRHGEALAAFGLGMPAPPSDDAGARAILPWDDVLVGEEEPGLEDDTAESLDADQNLAEGPASPAQLPHHTREEEERRRIRRRHISRWSKLLDKIPITSGLIVLRLTLVWWGLGNWDHDDDEPHQLVRGMLVSLANRDFGDSPELLSRFASLTAAALATMRDRIEIAELTERTLAFDRLTGELAWLMPEVDEAMVNQYRLHLRNAAGFELRTDEVLRLVAVWQREDPFGNAVAWAQGEGHTTMHLGDRLLRVGGRFGNTDLVALQVAERTKGPERVGIWAVNDRGGWTFVSWARPELIRARGTAAGRIQWKHHVLADHMGPASVARGNTSHGLVPHGPANVQFDEATAALHELGLSNPDSLGFL